MHTHIHTRTLAYSDALTTPRPWQGTHPHMVQRGEKHGDTVPIMPGWLAYS